MTKGNLLILVAQGLLQPFTTAQLTVAAWKSNNQMFGLPGYINKYPNHNAVLVTLMGKSGLVSKGKIRRVGKDLYHCP